MVVCALLVIVETICVVKFVARFIVLNYHDALVDYCIIMFFFWGGKMQVFWWQWFLIKVCECISINNFPLYFNFVKEKLQQKKSIWNQNQVCQRLKKNWKEINLCSSLFLLSHFLFTMEILTDKQGLWHSSTRHMLIMSNQNTGNLNKPMGAKKTDMPVSFYMHGCTYRWMSHCPCPPPHLPHTVKITS